MHGLGGDDGGGEPEHVVDGGTVVGEVGDGATGFIDLPGVVEEDRVHRRED